MLTAALLGNHVDPWVACEPEPRVPDPITVTIVPQRVGAEFRITSVVVTCYEEDSTPVMRQSSMPDLIGSSAKLGRQRSDLASGLMDSSLESSLVSKTVPLERLRIEGNGDSTHGVVVNIPMPKRRDPAIRGYQSQFHQSLPHCTIALALEGEEDKPRVDAGSFGAKPDEVWRLVWACSVLLTCAAERGERRPAKEMRALCEQANRLFKQVDNNTQGKAYVGLAFAACSAMILKNVAWGETEQTQTLSLECLSLEDAVMSSARTCLSLASSTGNLKWLHLSRLVREGLGLVIGFDAATFPVASFQSVRCGVWLEALFRQVADTELSNLKRSNTTSEQALRSRQEGVQALRSKVLSRLPQTFLNAPEVLDLFRLVEDERASCTKRVDTCRQLMVLLGLKSDVLDKLHLDGQSLSVTRGQLADVSAHLRRKSDQIVSFYANLFRRPIVVKPELLDGLDVKTEAPPYLGRLEPRSSSIPTDWGATAEPISRSVCFVRCASMENALLIVAPASLTHLSIYSVEHRVQRVVALNTVVHPFMLMNPVFEICCVCPSISTDKEFYVCVRSTKAKVAVANARSPNRVVIMRLHINEFNDALIANQQGEVYFENMPAFHDIGCMGQFLSGDFLLTSKSANIMSIVKRSASPGTPPKVLVINPLNELNKVIDGPPTSARLNMPVLSLAHAINEDRILFTGATPGYEALIRDIDCLGNIRTLCKIKSANLSQDRVRIDHVLPSLGENIPMYALSRDVARSTVHTLMKIRDGEFTNANSRKSTTAANLPTHVSFLPERESKCWACAWHFPARKSPGEDVFGAVSVGVTEDLSAKTWEFEVTAWDLARDSFGKVCATLMDEVIKANDAVVEVERGQVSRRMLDLASKTYWKTCSEISARSFKDYFSVFLQAAPGLKDVAQLYQNIMALGQTDKSLESARFFSEMQNALNIWIDLYKWPETCMMEDLVSLISMVKTGTNSVVSSKTLAKVFDSRHFFAPLEVGLELLSVALESSRMDARDEFRLPVVHWLARIDPASTTPRPLPSLALLKKTVAYWDRILAVLPLDESPKQMALNWMVVAHMKTVCARKISALRALVFLDSMESAAARDSSGKQQSDSSMSPSKQILLSNVVSIFGDDFQLGSFQTGLRAVTLDNMGGLKTWVWNQDPELDFFSKGVVPALKDADVVQGIVAEPVFSESWFTLKSDSRLTTPTEKPVNPRAMEEEEEMPGNSEVNKRAVETSNREQLPCIIMYSSGTFEAAGSGVYIFALTPPATTSAASSASQAGGIWISVGANCPEKYYRANQPIVLELGEGEHPISIRAFSRIPETRLIVEGPYTAPAAKMRLEKPNAAKRLPYPMAACLFAQSEVAQLGRRHALDSAAASITWILLRSSLIAAIPKDQVGRKGTKGGTEAEDERPKRKQGSALMGDAEPSEQQRFRGEDEVESYPSILSADRTLNSLTKLINELLDFGIDTASLLLNCFDSSPTRDVTSGELSRSAREFAGFLVRLRSNLEATWGAIKDSKRISVNQLERISQCKIEFARAILVQVVLEPPFSAMTPGEARGQGENLLPPLLARESSLAATRSTSMSSSEVVRAVDLLSHKALGLFQHLARLSQTLSSLGESVSSLDSAWDLTERIETLVRSYKKTQLSQIIFFFEFELCAELKPDSTTLTFIEAHHKSYFFKPLWRTVALSADSLEGLAKDDVESAHERDEGHAEKSKPKMESDEGSEATEGHLGAMLGGQLLRVVDEWEQVRTRILDQSVTWAELENTLSMNSFPDESGLSRQCASFFEFPGDSLQAKAALDALTQWTVLSLVAEHWPRTIQALPRLIPLLYLGDAETVPLGNTLSVTGEKLAAHSQDDLKALTLKEAAALATETNVVELVSPPVVLRLDENFCSELGACLPLFLWMRKTRSDAEFASSVEMAFTKPELQVPHELWNHDKGCVDETILGYLTDVRATLHPLVFGVEDMPVATLKRLFVAINDSLRQSAFTPDELVARVSAVNAKRRSLMQLLAGDEPSSADSHNQLLFLQSRSAKWCSESGQEVSMQYTVAVPDELDASRTKLVEKRLDREALADLQSTLVLGAAQDHEDEIVASLANTFVEELSVFDAINDCAARLNRRGHLCFQSYRIVVPFGGDSNHRLALKNSWQELDAVVHEWEDTVHRFRESFPLLACFSNRQVVEIVNLLLEAIDARLPSATDLVPSLVAIVAPGVSHDLAESSGKPSRFESDARAADLLLSRDPDLPDASLCQVMWAACKSGFAETRQGQSKFDPTAALEACGRVVSRVFIEHATKVPNRLVKLDSISIDRSSLATLGPSTSSGVGGSAVKVMRVSTRQKLVDVALTAYASVERFPSRKNCLFCSPGFVTGDSATNLVRRWAMDDDPSGLFCLINANALSFDDQREVGKLLESIAIQSTTRRCPFLIIIAPSANGVSEESALEAMFIATGRVAIAPLPLASLRQFVKLGLSARGVEAVCVSSALPGQGKTHAIRKRAHPEQLHMFRLNAILSMDFLIGLARKSESRAVHVDISDSAARSSGLGGLLFDYIFLNGLVDEATGEAWTWQSSIERPFKLFVEVPSKAPTGELRVCSMLESIVVRPSPATFDIDFETLKIGMGSLDFASARFDGTIQTRFA